MPLLTPEKALRDFPKTPAILSAILYGVNQKQAQKARDGANGWSVLEILGHMNEFEQAFFQRSRLIAETEMPKFPVLDPDALAKSHHYNDQKLEDVFTSYVTTRRAHLAYVQVLTPEQWQRKGIHMAYGELTLTENVISTTLHDVNHIDQIVKALGLSAPLAAL
ncbi:MAG: DinB family protein [Chloroflexota bacterium]